MLEISISKICKNYGFGNILNNISFDVMNGEIVSIVGENGSGKSTLLKIIAKEENATSGSVAIRKNGTLGYLSQTSLEEDDNILVKDILYRSVKEIIDIENKLKEYENKMLGATEKELDNIIRKYSNLQEKFINIGGYEVSEKIGRIVTGFKIENLLELNYNNLSGGEKRIVSFAALIIKNPDILLLDEPTNHLDIETLEWLENYLINYKGTILIVSHDRYFLDKITKKTILLEEGNALVFNTNYSDFLIENDKRKNIEYKEYKEQQKEIKAMRESIKKLREFGRLAVPGGESFFKRANSIEKRLEKLEKINKPKEKKIIPLEFNYQNRSGKDVLVVTNLNISYDNKIIFNNANMKINYGEHICLIGKNGSGKSSLIKNILSSNNNIKLGSNVKIGYIPQEIVFDKDSIVYDLARKYFIGEESHLRSALFKFMFVGNDIYKKISSLSGGEKVRLKLFCLMQEEVNFLILDEPTNHIDITTREILEDTLNGYKGTILFVSHDRYFINKLATKIISIEKNKLFEYVGNYDDYRNQKKDY
ncbi:MAG: ABC-F family ATP-binding cassette domain-containing protein [Bacilli bacterium]|nr:ABC-F family ATP-binding cassette domain-containing protein [Bacilli bacterium]